MRLTYNAATTLKKMPADQVYDEMGWAYSSHDYLH